MLRGLVCKRVCVPKILRGLNQASKHSKTLISKFKKNILLFSTLQGFILQPNISQFQTECIRPDHSGCEGKNITILQVENHVYENKHLSPLTLLFYLVVVDENIVLELQTLNSYILFELALFFTNKPSPLYVRKQK